MIRWLRSARIDLGAAKGSTLAQRQGFAARDGFRVARQAIVFGPPMLRGLARTAVLSVLAVPPIAVSAIEIKRIDHVLVLSGEIFRQDLDRVQAEFSKAPSITHVVLRNSMGGNSWTGYRLGELFRARGVTTVVSGHCVSSCSRLFLGGQRRLFSDDFPQSLTYVGFHGHYDFGKLNRQAIEKYDQIAWTQRFTDHKVDPALLSRWIGIERRAGDVRFYPDAVAARWQAKTFLCQGTESRRPEQCEKLLTDALSEGIITSRNTFSSPDSATLLYGQRQARYPTTNYAALDNLTKLPTTDARSKRDYQRFLAAKLPRAAAISSDGAHLAWSANSSRSVESALENCEKKSSQRCVLYAVDERVVFNRRATP